LERKRRERYACEGSPRPKMVLAKEGGPDLSTGGVKQKKFLGPEAGRTSLEKKRRVRVSLTRKPSVQLENRDNRRMKAGKNPILGLFVEGRSSQSHKNKNGGEKKKKGAARGIPSSNGSSLLNITPFRK